MCGLIGVITRTHAHTTVLSRTKYVEQALIVDAVRGADSTGVFAVPHINKAGDEAGYLKSAVGGGEFVETPDFIGLTRTLSSMRWVIGHNRFATVGGVESKTAHPFQSGPITLVHNGTLLGDGGLRTSQLALKVLVDSEAIACNLALHPAEEVIRDLDGAFALIWHDSRDDSLNVVRNSQRSLAYITNGAADTLFLASEAKMGEWLLSRNKVLNAVTTEYPVGVLHKYKEHSIIPTKTTISMEEARYQKAYSYHSNLYNATYKYKTPATKKVVPPTISAPALPTILFRTLLQNALHPLDRLKATPVNVESCTATCVCVSAGMPVMVFGKKEVLDAQLASIHWVVRPLAVSIVMGSDGEEIKVLIASVVTYLWTSAKEFQFKVPPMGNAAALEVVDGNALELLTLPGPDKKVLSAAQWYDYTSQGCCTCNRPVGIRDAEDLMWLDDESEDFLCGNCADEWESGAKV